MLRNIQWIKFKGNSCRIMTLLYLCRYVSTCNYETLEVRRRIKRSKQNLYQSSFKIRVSGHTYKVCKCRMFYFNQAAKKLHRHFLDLTQCGTGKSLSEALNLKSTNPQYDYRLVIELPVQYMKITSSEHVVYINCSECQIKNKKTISVHNIVIFMY